MQHRLQRGSLRQRRQGGVLKWFATYWENGQRKGKTLGTVSSLSKTQAQQQLDTLLAPINERNNTNHEAITFGRFVQHIALPIWERRWKESTKGTTTSRIQLHLIKELGDVELRALNRETLQTFLDEKGKTGMSAAVLKHLRWDLRMLCRIGVAEGLIERNPAELLYATGGTMHERHVMTKETLATVINTFGLRERLIIKLSGTSGMRPGEVYALKFDDETKEGFRITRRVYRGKINTPKSNLGVRLVAIGPSARKDLEEWKQLQQDVSPNAWIFPSENGKTPLSPSNHWRRHIRPVLIKIGLGNVSFQVLRRTCSSLLNDDGADPRTVSQQLGHSVDVDTNVYWKAAVQRQADAINTLDQAISQPTTLS
jgi:integrase